MPLLSGALPVLGHNTELRRDRMGFVERVALEGHPIARLAVPLANACVVTEPAIVQEVLVDRAKVFEKAEMTRYTLYPLGGEGLFTSRGELWRRQRKVMAPLFQQGQLGRYAADMVEAAERDVATWRDGQVLELARETTRITMSVAGKTLFDADTFGEADAIGAALTVALEWTGNNTASPLAIAHILARRALRAVAPHVPAESRARLASLGDRLEGPVILPGEEGRELRAAIALLDERVQRMIDERRASGLERQDLLTKLLSSRDDDGAPMSDKQVRDEILTLFVAGHETTANALAWVVHLLCRHPRVYAELQAEVDALGHRPTVDDLPRLSLALRVFKEALRLYPPVYIFSRQATEPVVVAGYELPKRTIVLLCPYAQHRRPDVWPDPERFDPERFRPEAEAQRHKLAWLPFGAGPRVCIGNHFAMMEAQLVLAVMLGRATYESLGDSRPDPHATLRPAGGMPTRVRLRQAPWERAEESPST